MSFVVTAFSWAGWIWTGLFFAVTVPILFHRARIDAQAGSGGQE